MVDGSWDSGIGVCLSSNLLHASSVKISLVKTIILK